MIKNKKLIERNLRHRARHKRSLNVLTVHLSTGFDLATLYVMAKEDGFGPVGGKRWERSPVRRKAKHNAVFATGEMFYKSGSKRYRTHMRVYVHPPGFLYRRYRPSKPMSAEDSLAWFKSL
jgi:hypothetical protein